MRAIRGSRLVAILLSVGLVMSFILMPGAAGATPLAPAPTPVVSGTDMVVAGIGGLYTVGSGELTVAGIGDGVVTSAWLYWSGPTNSTDPAANATISFAGADITGTSIGIDSSNCFGFDASQAFRADVTALVRGDGAYTIANTSKASPNAEADGASLIVFYDDGDRSNNRDVYVYEGNDSNGSEEDAVWDATLGGIEYTEGIAEMTLHVANGQPQAEDGTFSLNGVTFASEHVFDGASVPTAPGGIVSLWDIKTWDITSFLTPGTNTLQLANSNTLDCLSLIVATVSVQPVSILPALWTDLVDQIRVTGTRSQQSMMLLYVLMAQPQSERAPANACLVLGQMERYVQNQVSQRRLSAGEGQLVLQRSQAIREELGCQSSPR